MKIKLFLLVLLSVLAALSQSTPVNQPALTFGTAAPSPLLCGVPNQGAIYVRSQNPANAPVGVFRCTQTGGQTYAWLPIGHFVGATLPATCAVGDVAFDSDATAGQNFYGCTAVNTWSLMSGSTDWTRAAGTLSPTNPADNVAVGNTVIGPDGTVLGTDIATPSNPVSGKTKLYPKSGKWCSLDSSGNEYCTGGAGAGVNSIEGYTVDGSGNWTENGTVLATLAGNNTFTGNNLMAMGSTGSISTKFTNDGTTGTTQYRIAKLTSAGTVIRATTVDLEGMGIVSSASSTSGFATIVISGRQECEFDGSVTVGNWAKLSTTTDGRCMDGGATPPVGPLVIGKIATTLTGNRATVYVAPFRREAGDATSIQGVPISATPPVTTKALTYNPTGCGGSGCVEWQTLDPAIAHDFLGPLHNGTDAASPARGAIIYGNASSLWARMTVGTAGQFLMYDGTDLKKAGVGVGLTTDTSGATGVMKINPFDTAYNWGREDFQGNPAWLFNRRTGLIGTCSSNVTIDSESGHPGIMRVTTGTSSNDTCFYTMDQGSGSGKPFTDLALRAFEVQLFFRVGTVANANYFAGVGDGVSALALQKFFGAGVDTTGNVDFGGGSCTSGSQTQGNWTLMFMPASGTMTCVDTGIAAVNNTWYGVRIRSVTAGTFLISFADNSFTFGSESSVTLSPSAASYTTGVRFQTKTTAARTMDVDMISWVVAR